MRPGDAVAGVGETVLLGAQALGAIPRRPLELRQVLRQAYLQGNQSLPLMAIMAAFVGLVVAYQSGLGLIRFGAQQYIGYLTVLAVVREMIPVLTALVIGGRIAAGIAAELGAMVVTEQVAAVRALGADPVKKLVMPRVAATTLVVPALTILGDVIASATGMVVARLQLHISAATYVTEVQARVFIPDFLSGVFKAIAFGFIGAAIACRAGLKTSGGTAGVGRATTRAVVQASLTVVVLDFFLSRMMQPWFR
jgi:phospholipid/cholesterol/gamma-HCH transport system permease protein